MGTILKSFAKNNFSGFQLKNIAKNTTLKYIHKKANKI